MCLEGVNLSLKIHLQFIALHPNGKLVNSQVWFVMKKSNSKAMPLPMEGIKSI
jgi:hypothetical protein